MSLAYLDGKFIDSEAIKISPSDYGFARGMTLFELTRVYNSVPFRLDEHIQRFMRGGEAMGLSLPLSARDMTVAVHRLTSENKFMHSIVKFYLTMGECGKSGDYGFSTSSGFTPHMIMLEEQVQMLHPDAPKGLPLYQKGLALKTVPFARQISDTKTINYAPGLIATRQLRGTGYDEILYLDPNGYITETTVSNFFCVIDGALHTPANGMLPGVTRMVMLELAEKLGIPVSETDIAPEELTHATEAFTSGTYTEMMPVRMIDNLSFKSMMDAPVFSKLRRAYTDYVADYIKTRRT